MLHCGRPASQPSVCQGNRAVVSHSLVPRPHFSHLHAGKMQSGQLPIPFLFKCAGILAHCSFLI